MFPFTSDAAEFNAIKAGSIDVGYIPQDDVPQLKQVLNLGYNYFGMPDYGMNFANYNFKDKTGDFNNIVNQLYFRQAMAHLEDQQGWITAFMHGAGAPAYGPIPAYPQSPYLPADAATDPYPFNVATAVSLLKSNGWTVNPGGTDVCAKAGHRRRRLRRGHPGRHQAGVQLHLQHVSVADRRPGHRPRVEGVAGGHPHHAAGQQLQLHDPELP